MNDNQNITARRLIDRLVPDPHWGAMYGFLSTTYDLDPDFLELDFLPSVFGLPARSAWATRVAIEKHLSELDARAVILTEARRYRGRPRSLQLEVLPALIARGSSLHAKVSLFVFDRAVRLIVGSANLVERGYRRNREAAAVLTASLESPEATALISEALIGAERALSSWLSEDARRVIRKAKDVLVSLGSVRANADKLFCWSDGQVRLWRTFLDRWPAEQVIKRISIISPFWSEDAGLTLKAFLAESEERDILGSQAEVRLLTDAYEGPNGQVLPVLPAGYATFDWDSLGVRATAQAVSSKVQPEEVGGMEDFAGKRDLHAKIVLLEGDQTGMAYLGSANFTAHGWGFAKHGTGVNIEAGLILRVRVQSVTLAGLIPDLVGDPVALTKENLHLLAVPEKGSGDGQWPEFITNVLLQPTASNDNKLELVIKVAPDEAPTKWSAKLQAKEGYPAEILVDIADGLNACQPFVVVPLRPERLNRLLVEQEVWICWNECPSGRAVPLNVDTAARDRLPISPNQRISEDNLISYYQGKISWEDLFPDPDSPTPPPPENLKPAPPALVDKSRIQSYQVREFVEALTGIREDLKAATQSERSMRLALSGAVSPLALTYTVLEAVKRGSRTPMAAAFQLVEIAGCLRVARSFEVPKHLSGLWEQHLRNTISKIVRLLRQLVSEHPESFAQNRAFRRYENTVLRI